MNDADVSKQIQQMVRFIRQEAEEKANEIQVSAKEVRVPFEFRSSCNFALVIDLWLICWLWWFVLVDVGVQYREVAADGGWEEEDQAGVWEEREASRSSKENVLFRDSFMLLFLWVFCWEWL